MSRGSNIIHITDKITGSKTKVPKHGIDSGLECTLEVFEQISEDMGQKKTPETLSKTGGGRLSEKSNIPQRESKGFGVL